MMGFVPTQDLEKARAFYEGLLGLRSVSEDQFVLVLDANGTMIRVTKVTDFKPQPCRLTIPWGDDRDAADGTGIGLLALHRRADLMGLRALENQYLSYR